MFKYVSDISELSHYIINNFIENKYVAIDATLGNGYDTGFLSSCFKKVYSFEVQKEACEKYEKEKDSNVVVINDSHHKFNEYINEPVNCIMYNLGFLPGGDKSITTLAETTLKSITDGLELLDVGGIMTIAIYIGHNEGKEEESCIMDYVSKLPKERYGVMQHKYINRSKTAPLLIAIEKKI